ncbi:MAG: 3-deoxy-D-manno-octulosonic acid kinase [Rhodanobacteraceae bacterium]|nr:3-deoxy-D-manno-octulosonic acid kinase [Rhodanobacteraceae bacterium]
MSESACQTQVWTDGVCHIVYDAARLSLPSSHWFLPETWPQRSLLAAGRGQTWAIDGPFGAAVLRHYRRGGALARLLRDQYLWTGLESTRPLREFRLLAAALDAGLPVPRPLAARIGRAGGFYSGDLIMSRIANASALSTRLAQPGSWSELDWGALGEVLGRAHALGYQHADLNAHNILIDAAGRYWLIDWDRGVHRRPGDWQARVLQRLQRSLRKLYGERVDQADARQAWQRLLDAHARSALSSAHA